MGNHQNDISIDTGGGSVIGSAIGQDNSLKDVNIKLEQVSNTDETNDLTVLLNELKEFLEKLKQVDDIERDEIFDINSDLIASIDALDRPEPNKKRMLEKLKSSQAALKSLEDSTSSVISLGEMLSKIISFASSIIL